MRFEGTIKTWHDDRGFGFIEPTGGGQELFVHIKAFPTSMGRPIVGSKVTFEVEPAAEGKKRAVRVQLPQASKSAARTNTQKGRQSRSWETSSVVALSIFAVSYVVMSLAWKLPLLVGAAYLVMSIVCAGFYWHDKVSARLGEWRTSEEALILMGVFCGWPGAIVAQQVLRHKTTKPSFRMMHWFTVVLNLTILYLVGTPLLGMLLSR
ncbi:cold shock and DUF1294 domain-containing protein [Rhodoferax saidenbachensis]|uniref:Uncharacterized membrane protein YsdA (DUF1294 family)/cold shock CspA family protein n=1 Tax=Rhodoferax saidenbachensis TaxID=1484693 RepID=A0ABU1ZQU6_9BURK|nr:cold shock and DUF1294 domain-containing protein [Rhodoferax saidenbachensis]MDR7307926.1 uncharacterized membrane protein YsdA (DUF1294 family)/cold shock CspA family protein [Rhodoferax saidenbachensis]